MRAYFRLLFAFLALALLAAAVIAVVYIWENRIEPERRLQAEIKAIRDRPKAAPDHGAKIYDDAVTQLRTGDLAGAVSNLHHLLTYYTGSSKYDEARRIVGEINLDRLLSRDPAPGKVEYIVQSGDSLTRIAQRSESTIGYIMHVNDRMGSGLQRGDQLIVCPLNFGVLAWLEDGKLELRTADDRFFKEYRILGYKAPPGVPSEFDTEITSLVINTGARAVPVGTDRYVGSAKELRSKRRGVTLRALTGDEATDKYLTGIFLAREDVEELSLLLRPGTKLYVRRKQP